MIETKDYHINVLIEGSLLFDTEVYLRCVDIEAFSDIDKNDCVAVINVDEPIDGSEYGILLASSKKLCCENAIYHTRGDVVSYQENGGIAKDSPYYCINSFNNNLKETLGLLSQNFDYMTKRIINRMIYLNILSIYEFFIGDICATCFLRFDNINKLFYEHIKPKDKTAESVEYTILGMKHDDLLKLIKSFFLVEIPDNKFIKQAYATRNDIAHRYNSTKKREYVMVQDEDIYNLAEAAKSFVYEIFERIIDKAYTK